jgi:hypothetical protein
VSVQTTTPPSPPSAGSLLRNAGRGFWLRAAAYSALAVVALGIPTVLIPNSLFTRMIEPRWWSYALWVVTAVLVGLVLAARRLTGGACPVEGRTAAGGGLGFLAVACPTCNVLVVSALGLSGAMTFFAPVQPVLGLAGVALLTGALLRILRSAARTS